VKSVTGAGKPAQPGSGSRSWPSWSRTAAFIVVDALLVLSLFHEHLLPPSPSLDHALTAAGTAISFLLLSHAALWLKARLLALFAGLVLAGWLALITFAAWWSAGGDQHQSLVIGAEVALAAVFAFAAFTLILLIWDHAQLVRNAVASERRRASLSRFFAPAVVAELEARGETPALERRDAAVMFVDLRSFTRFSESVEPFEVAAMLSEYRELVIATVFAWGGTVDKFIGDGVMAVFGHPRAAPDDAERAVRCAEEVAARLAAWSEQRRRNGRVPLEAGIGIHDGPVVAGVLASSGHHEFSVFGDAVNIAERLERATKILDASVVASQALLGRVLNGARREPWTTGRAIDLDGRNSTIAVTYIPRGRTPEQAPPLETHDGLCPTRTPATAL
jgi:adenylate cyclase